MVAETIRDLSPWESCHDFIRGTDHCARHLRHEKLTRQAVADGFTQIKLKVGADLADDLRRMRTARAAVGPDVRIAVDANQRWAVTEAIEWTKSLAPFDPYWIEEPTSPNDVLGHASIRAAVAPIRVATGEHVQNRILFKQLLQAGAIDSSSSTPPGSTGSTRTWRSCSSRPSSACRSALAPEGWGYASSCSTWPCSTTWNCPARRRTG